MTTTLQNFEAVKTSLIKRRANRDAVANVIAAEDATLRELRDKVQMLTDGIALMQTFSGSLRSDVVKRFEDLLTTGVRQVWGKDYRIVIDFHNSGNSIGAEFYAILPNGKKVTLKNGEGGGLKDFVGVLQRILYLVLEPTHPTKIIFLDECLKAVDCNRAALAFKFIAQLAIELGVQLVFITHEQAAKAMSEVPGVSVVEITMVNDESQIKVLH